MLGSIFKLLKLLKGLSDGFFLRNVLRLCVKSDGVVKRLKLGALISFLTLALNSHELRIIDLSHDKAFVEATVLNEGVYVFT